MRYQVVIMFTDGHGVIEPARDEDHSAFLTSAEHLKEVAMDCGKEVSHATYELLGDEV